MHYEVLPTLENVQSPCALPKNPGSSGRDVWGDRVICIACHECPACSWADQLRALRMARRRQRRLWPLQHVRAARLTHAYFRLPPGNT